MRNTRNFLIVFVTIGLMLCGILEKSFGGVRQSRSVDSNRTNIGTNAYADMNSNPESNYAYVNPNYSDGATVYSDESGQVAVDPRQAGAAEDGTAMYNGYNNLVAGQYYDNYNAMPLSIGAILESIPSTAVPVMVKSTTYYYDSSYNLFFMQVFDGGVIVYQIIPPPLGVVVTTLPTGCLFQYINGKSISVCGNTSFQQVAGGYQVVR